MQCFTLELTRKHWSYVAHLLASRSEPVNRFLRSLSDSLTPVSQRLVLRHFLGRRQPACSPHPNPLPIKIPVLLWDDQGTGVAPVPCLALLRLEPHDHEAFHLGVIGRIDDTLNGEFLAQLLGVRTSREVARRIGV